MALLLNHSEQGPVVFVKTLSTPTKSVAVELQIAAPEHEAEHVHAGLLFTDRQGQPQRSHPRAVRRAASGQPAVANRAARRAGAWRLRSRAMAGQAEGSCGRVDEY